MHFLEDITQLRLLMELMVLKHSRTSLTGLVHGLLKDRECIMELHQCRNPEKTQLIQLLLIQEALSFQFLQMYLIRFKPNGKKLFQNLTAHLIKHSAILLKDVTQLHQRLNLSDSKWVITFLKLTQHNIYIKQTKTNATLLFINADFQVRIRIFSSLVTPSWDISIQFMILIVTK